MKDETGEPSDTHHRRKHFSNRTYLLLVVPLRGLSMTLAILYAPKNSRQVTAAPTSNDLHIFCYCKIKVQAHASIARLPSRHYVLRPCINYVSSPTLLSVFRLN